MEGFRKRLSQPGSKKPRLARIKYATDGASCSCGWVTVHQREKIVEDRIDRHLAKAHGGRGFRF